MSNPYESPSANLSEGLFPCSGCGHKIHHSAAVCPNCGASQRKGRYKSNVVAALLAFFLGGLGIHRFYLGQWWGILYLLFVWTFIPGIVSFVEFFVFLISDKQKWDDKYNEGKPAAAGEGSGLSLIIVLLLSIPVVIAIIGILAAIALPAYQDYTLRAEVAVVLATDVEPTKSSYAEFVERTGISPDSNIMLGLSEPYSTVSGAHIIEANEQMIVLTFAGQKPQLQDKTMVFIPEVSGREVISWDCTEGTLEKRYRPALCR